MTDADETSRPTVPVGEKLTNAVAGADRSRVFIPVAPVSIVPARRAETDRGCRGFSVDDSRHPSRDSRWRPRSSSRSGFALLWLPVPTASSIKANPRHHAKQGPSADQSGKSLTRTLGKPRCSPRERFQIETNCEE